MRESKAKVHSSLASKGAPKAPSEPGIQMPSESAEDWTQFRPTGDEAATTSQKAKTPSKKGGEAVLVRVAKRTPSPRPLL